MTIRDMVSYITRDWLMSGTAPHPADPEYKIAMALKAAEKMRACLQLNDCGDAQVTNKYNLPVAMEEFDKWAKRE